MEWEEEKKLRDRLSTITELTDRERALLVLSNTICCVLTTGIPEILASLIKARGNAGISMLARSVTFAVETALKKGQGAIPINFEDREIVNSVLKYLDDLPQAKEAFEKAKAAGDIPDDMFAMAMEKDGSEEVPDKSKQH